MQTATRQELTCHPSLCKVYWFRWNQSDVVHWKWIFKWICVCALLYCFHKSLVFRVINIPIRSNRQSVFSWRVTYTYKLWNRGTHYSHRSCEIYSNDQRGGRSHHCQTNIRRWSYLMWPETLVLGLGKVKNVFKYKKKCHQLKVFCTHVKPQVFSSHHMWL